MTSDTAAADESGIESGIESGADEPSRGRPRDEERTAAILEATHTVLHVKGWGDLTMGDIAKEAGCGLATIYRRWSTKEELVAAAMLDRPLPPIEATGDAYTDLRQLVLAFGQEMSEMGPSVIGFLAATQSDAVLSAAFSESVMSTTRPHFAALVREVLGEDSPHIEMIIDGVFGSLFMRASVLQTMESPEAWTDEVMALIDRLR
ncbi:MAG: TetR/AcrR family transcriptional regulator [Actinomycetota bacterium]